MSRSVFQPIGQKRLTNIAVVRIRKLGKRFEIACYKNKVLNWRNGVETDLDEVLQTEAVFANVSKGVLAKREDLVAAFGTDDQRAVCLHILAEGELQVSDKERAVELGTLFRDVAAQLAERCINPTTRRPYTIPMLERALRDAHLSVDPHRPAKAQALEALPLLQARIPIERARMRLRVAVPLSGADELRALLAKEGATVEEQELQGDQLLATVLVEPGLYRPLHALVQSASGGRGRLDIVALAAIDAAGAAPEPAAPAAERPAAAGALTLPDERPAAAAGSSGFAPAAAAAAPAPRPVRAAGPGPGSQAAPARAVYPRGPIAGLPDEHASRKERFAELDALQPGWEVELRERGGEGGILDAVFYSPAGECVGTYAAARRAALAASKAAAAAGGA